MPTAALRDIEIYYERTGSGPPLLLINGSGASLDTSGPLLTPFREQFELVGYDQRGLGRTSVPAAPPTMADYAADALAVADHVGWDRFRVVGLSFGGMVAQELAVTAPERLERLALVSTSPGGPDFASYPLHELADLPATRQAEVGRLLIDTRYTDEWLDEHPIDRMIADRFTQRADTARTEDQRRGEALQMEARRHHDVVDRLGAVSCPTLVACGRYDGIASIANGEAIATRVPGAQLRTYDGGHVVFLFQDPAALPEVLAFLAG